LLDLGILPGALRASQTGRLRARRAERLGLEAGKQADRRLAANTLRRRASEMIEITRRRVT